MLNIRLNCLTSVQLHVPEIGHLISKSSISIFTDAKSSFSKADTILDLILSIDDNISCTLGLVSINCFLSNLSLNLFSALTISFWTFKFNFSICSSINTSALYLFFESLLSIKGSLKASTCPEATHVLGCINIAESIPTIFSFN